MEAKPLIEPLETRRLLAGVTVLMHGHEGNIKGWVSAAADAIAQRAGGSRQVSQYTMEVAEDSRRRLAVTGFSLDSGPEMISSSTGEAIIKLDWSSVADASHSTESVGEVVAGYMLRSHGLLPPLASLPMHLIGHSRGASLGVAISQQLGARGVWVDQNTYLDPHPVDGSDGPLGGLLGSLLGGDFGDAGMHVYSNVVFADDYWRSDGKDLNFDPDGEPVKGAHNVDLNDTVQKKHVVSAHVAVTSYYHGTIDTEAVFNGDHPVFDDWYDHSPAKPARDQTGFTFSRLGGGGRPADGLSSAFGGRAERADPGQSGSQWGNINSLRVLNGRTVTAGDKFRFRFLRQDRDGGDTVVFYLDRDRNPFNGLVRTIRRVNLGQALGVTPTRVNGRSDGISAGRYYVMARITDAAGHSRFAYTSRITVAAPKAMGLARAAAAPAAGFSNTRIAGPPPGRPIDLVRI